MRCGRRVSAAMLVAAAFAVCCVCVSTGPARAGDDGAQLLLFSGADLWRDGRFLHGWLLWSPGGIEREGFTLKAMLSGGTYRYRSGALNDAWVTDPEEGKLSCCPVGGSSATVSSSRSSPGSTSRTISAAPTIRPIDCTARPWGFAPRSICGSSRRRRPCSPPTHRCPRSPPAIRRA